MSPLASEIPTELVSYDDAVGILGYIHQHGDMSHWGITTEKPQEFYARFGDTDRMVVGNVRYSDGRQTMTMVDDHQVIQVTVSPRGTELEESVIDAEFEVITDDEVVAEVEKEIEQPESFEDLEDNVEVVTDFSMEEVEEEEKRWRARVDEGISNYDTVDIFMEEAGRYPLLTKEEEIVLATAIEIGESAHITLQQGVEEHDHAELEAQIRRGNDAYDALVNSNLRLVVHIAKKYTGRGVEFSDLIQMGNMGLMRGVEKYDYHRGYRVSTYVFGWIKQGITRGVDNSSRTIRIPIHMSETIRRISGVMDQLKQEYGRDATVDEIAIASDLPVSKVKFLLTVSQPPEKLDREIDDSGTSSSRGDFVPDNRDNPVRTSDDHRLQEQLDDAFESLSAQEALLLKLHYGLFDGHEWTYVDIAKRLGISAKTARLAGNKALQKLKANSGDKLHEYLEKEEPDEDVTYY